jgi:hypothetical protein
MSDGMGRPEVFVSRCDQFQSLSKFEFALQENRKGKDGLSKAKPIVREAWLVMGFAALNPSYGL